MFVAKCGFNFDLTKKGLISQSFRLFIPRLINLSIIPHIFNIIHNQILPFLYL